MKLSVITIAYNDRAGLSKTFESIQSQDWPDLEHIIIDGGSTDGSVDYLRNLPSSAIWLSEKDNGRYDAMNKGAALASGDVLWFMNSADVFHTSSSARVVMQNYCDSVFDWGYGFSKITDGDELVGSAGKIPFDHARFLLGGQVIPHQASFFRRQFLSDLNGYNESFGITADQEFMMRASVFSKPRVLAEVLCDFDATGVGSKRGAWAHYQDMVSARSVADISVTGHEALDRAASLLFWAHTVSDRLLRRMLRNSKPRFASSDNK